MGNDANVVNRFLLTNCNHSPAALLPQGIQELPIALNSSERAKKRIHIAFAHK